MLWQAPYSSPAPPGLRSCYVSVLVKPTDFDNLSEYVTRTVVREGGVETLIHGECGPLRTGATYAGNGYFECALQVPLPMSPTGTWEFESWASDAVDDHELRHRTAPNCIWRDVFPFLFFISRNLKSSEIQKSELQEKTFLSSMLQSKADGRSP